ncbi:MAG: S8 family serine peptidase [Pseudomonadota bacterium]
MTAFATALLLALPGPAALAAPGAGLLSGGVQDAVLAWESGPAALEGWRRARAVEPPAEGLRVTLELRRGADLDAALDWLEAVVPDAWVEVALPEKPAHPPLVQAVVPWGSLLALEEVPGARSVREPAMARAEEVVSEGYAAMLPSDWHAQGVRGARVTIAVLDVGFEGYEGLLGGELPLRVGTSFLASVSGGDHGTAVAEVLHDFAPDADLELVSFSTESEYLQAVDLIAALGVDLVNASVGFDNRWPADGTSPYTQAADALVRDAGALYVAAAGNENERYRLGPLRLADEGRVSIDGLTSVQVATSGGYAWVSFRWSEPMGQASVDLDLAVYDEQGNPCDQGAQGADPQDGDDDPYEEVRCHVGGAWATVEVLSNGEGVDDLEGFLYSIYGLDPADATGERNLTLPADTVRGLAVGAVDLPQTNRVAAYSSRGPTEDGRVRPQLVAPSMVSTLTRGVGGFGGTSAATPHVTGAAALVMQADKHHMDPDALRTWLMDQAEDLPPAGEDDASGAGFPVLTDIPWRGCHCAAAAGRPWSAALVLLGLSLGVARRKVLVHGSS